LGNELFDSTKHYKLVYDSAEGINKYEKAESYDETYDGMYYVKSIKIDDNGKEVIEYIPAYVVNNSNYLYVENTFYTKVSEDVYALATDKLFDNSIEYYTFTSKSNEELALLADPLVARATTFDPSATYYTYNKAATINVGHPTGAVVKVESQLDEATFNNGEYYILAPKTFVGITYHYDTKEYRAAKFTNEFT
jgi:hypothetical protein